MKDLGQKSFSAHAFVCTNARTDGRDDCAKFGGQEFFAKMKAQVKDNKMSASHKVTRTGCLGYCNAVGCTVAIYRSGEPSRWYNEVTPDDYERIWNEFTAPPQT